MQFSCNQDTLSKYLNAVSRVSSSKPGLPILNNVLFETLNGKLIMKATDLELGISCWIGAEVKAEGKITVPSKQLSEFVNSVPSERIDAELKGNLFNVSTLKNIAQFNTTVADDFPSMATVENDEPLLKIPKDELIEAVGKVSFACAKDDIKPVLTGIKVEINNDSLAFVAADGLRLSRFIIKLKTSCNKVVDILVPVKTMQEIAKLVEEFNEDDGDDFVSMYLIPDKNQVLFRFNDIDLISRLIDGQFPDYKVIIPTSFQTQLETKKSDFFNALKIVNIIARNVVGNKIFLNINTKNNEVTLTANQAEVGNNKSSFNVKVSGNDIDMAFSGRFLSEILSNIDVEDIVFECTSPVAPGVFKVKDDDRFIHLVMPMRL